MTRQIIRAQLRRQCLHSLGVGLHQRPVYSEPRRALRRIAFGQAKRHWQELRKLSEDVAFRERFLYGRGAVVPTTLGKAFQQQVDETP